MRAETPDFPFHPKIFFFAVIPSLITLVSSHGFSSYLHRQPNVCIREQLPSSPSSLTALAASRGPRAAARQGVSPRVSMSTEAAHRALPSLSLGAHRPISFTVNHCGRRCSERAGGRRAHLGAACCKSHYAPTYTTTPGSGSRRSECRRPPPLS